MELDPADLTLRERYKLLIGAIVPRPIAFVSTLSPAGRANLAPYSFFSGVGSDPMALLFSVGNLADGAEKDTLRNARPEREGGLGEFVVNVSVERYAREVAAASEELPHGESEFELVGLEPAPSRRVRPPRVAESPVCFECETLEIVSTNPGHPGGANVVVGRVVHVHVDDAVIDARLRIDPERLAAIGRMGGPGYSTTRDRFEMPRGRSALVVSDPLKPAR